MILPFIIKIAFLYIDDKKAKSFGNQIVVPTYRVSYEVYPEYKNLKFTIAESDIDKNHGKVSPYFVSTIYKEGE